MLPPAAIDVSIVGDLLARPAPISPIYFHAVPATDTSQLITWTFGDKTTDKGAFVSHLYQNAGTYDVTAQIGDRPPRARQGHCAEAAARSEADDGRRDGSVVLRVQLANAGKLTVGMVGVPGVHPMKQKMKRGTHTIQMKLPPACGAAGSSWST